MDIRLIAVGERLPAWVQIGYQEYAKRLPKEYRLELIEVKPVKRSLGYPPERIRAEEGARLLNHVRSSDELIALDERGKCWDTLTLAKNLRRWHDNNQSISLLIGGADGLAADCRQQAQHIWSLSQLTLPHGLVRIMVAEQLYRAWSILVGHPYHRY